jgi:chorismate mutase
MIAIRGATFSDNTKEAIGKNVKTLIDTILTANKLRLSDFVSVMFSVADGITAYNPATAFRGHFGGDIPLFCVKEATFDGSVENCIRVMVFVKTNKTAAEMVHVYLNGAEILRPDIAK